MRSKHMVIGLITVNALRFSLLDGLDSVRILDDDTVFLFARSMQSLNDTAVGVGLFVCTAPLKLEVFAELRKSDSFVNDATTSLLAPPTSLMDDESRFDVSEESSLLGGALSDEIAGSFDFAFNADALLYDKLRVGRFLTLVEYGG